ncbi:MAG: hypothetical protein HY292_06715 [Planctomycetes bacterium]|nr:hypothetical protein [Planctomycetota bacterium]
MRSFFASLALVPSIFFASPTFAQDAKPTDLDKIVPADALVHIAADGIDPVKAALVDLLNAIMPGMGGMMIEGQVQQALQQPGMSEIDTAKPITFSFLPSETSIFGAPIKNTEAFQKALKDSGDEEVKSIIAGQGTSILSLGGDVKLDDLRKAGTAKAPSLAGPIRGFVNMKAVYSKYHEQIESGLAMMQAMAAAQSGGGSPPDMAAMIKGFAADVPRVDFAFIPSKSGLEIATSLTPSPEAKGFIASIAKGQASSGTNKYLAAIPANSSVAFAGRLSPDLAQAYMGLVDLVASGATAEGKAEFKSLLERMFALTAGDFAVGISAGSDGSSMCTVGAMTCADKEKERAIMKEAASSSGAIQKLASVALHGGKMTAEYKAGAETIDGVEVDQVTYTIDASAVTDPAFKASLDRMTKTMFCEPFRFAFPAGTVVVAYGKGNGDAVKATLASLKSNTVSSPAAKALPSGMAFSASVNLVEYLKIIATMAPPEAAGMLGMLKNLPAGKDYLTFTAAPKGGAAEMRLNIPAAAIQSIVTGLQGGAMGGGPK